ncbi:Crp/Fnr family transcriptional regulator [Anaerobacillus isosaccharinicus]|uniref:Crp/Fnr family transcriptional regulator n=1 Tax=Anaerobacillus isosaccharinicus TaxID=1532552 RepID=A0A1S2LHK1_9BACI|nr:Crp/Fnr family transcriptional regulator [Anaerobacillus isosaccharinicus]MBA5588342.1 Crp/Fnr family transcriptional regulator [Anaerobacillus isosaccharinicus]QOY38223.1 Crp/Fnr family transcriptional regulator [Anaerobacillus isosaccharinicus]
MGFFYENEVHTFLSEFPSFINIDEIELKEMSCYFSYKKVKKNNHIFLQGDRFHSIYFLFNGRVKISRGDNHGREQLVGVCNDGEMFPHLGYYFDNRGYPASALVLEDTHLLYVPSENIRKLLTDYPSISIILLKVMGEKMIDLQCRLEEKLLSSIHEQVIKLLLRLAKKHGVRLSNGTILFLTPFQNKELACIIGSTRETVSRIMNKLEGNSMIERDQQGRLIINEELLKNEI